MCIITDKSMIICEKNSLMELHTRTNQGLFKDSLGLIGLGTLGTCWSCFTVKHYRGQKFVPFKFKSGEEVSSQAKFGNINIKSNSQSQSL